MGEKEETVEVTIELPKHFLEVLEAEGYFGLGKEAFYQVAVRRSITCEVNEMDNSETKSFHKKYGKEFDGLTFDL